MPIAPIAIVPAVPSLPTKSAITSTTYCESKSAIASENALPVLSTSAALEFDATYFLGDRPPFALQESCFKLDGAITPLY